MSDKLIALVVNWSNSNNSVCDWGNCGNMGWVRAVKSSLVHDNSVGWGVGTFIWNHNVSCKVILVVDLWDGMEVVNWGKGTNVIWVSISCCDSLGQHASSFHSVWSVNCSNDWGGDLTNGMFVMGLFNNDDLTNDWGGGLTNDWGGDLTNDWGGDLTNSLSKSGDPSWTDFSSGNLTNNWGVDFTDKMSRQSAGHGVWGVDWTNKMSWSRVRGAHFNVCFI